VTQIYNGVDTASFTPAGPGEKQAARQETGVLPVIASEVGGNPELVADGKTGFLVDPHKPGDMADKITAYMADPKMMGQHGERGRHLVMQQFSIQAMVENYEAVYRGL
jgi:glycosyltransferase involved in cell wall biosynthesis